MYSFTLPIRPPSNQGIGEIDGPPPSEQPFADIRDNRFPVASFDLREDSDVTYGTQIGVVGPLVGCAAPPFEFTDVDVQNRLPMHSFNLPIHPTSNEGIGEMDRLSLSEHSLSGTRDDDFPVAPLDLCGNSDLMYNPQFSVVGSLVGCGALPLDSRMRNFRIDPRCVLSIRRCSRLRMRAWVNWSGHPSPNTL
jgi:hypothetical protein